MLGKTKDQGSGEAPATVVLGWGVRVDRRQWVGLDGLSSTPWAWQRRSHAERLATAWQGMGHRVELLRATRRRGCVPPAREPWDDGFDPKTDLAQCGHSLAWEAVENRRAARAAAAAERAAARALAAAARADRQALREARERARAEVPADLARQWAIVLRADGSDRFWSTLKTLEKATGRTLYDRDGSDPEAGDTARDLVCEAAADEARRDLPLARRLLRLVGARCRTGAEVVERVARERAQLAARRRARDAKAARTAARAARA